MNVVSKFAPHPKTIKTVTPLLHDKTKVDVYYPSTLSEAVPMVATCLGVMATPGVSKNIAKGVGLSIIMYIMQINPEKWSDELDLEITMVAATPEAMDALRKMTGSKDVEQKLHLTAAYLIMMLIAKNVNDQFFPTWVKNRVTAMLAILYQMKKEEVTPEILQQMVCTENAQYMTQLYDLSHEFRGAIVFYFMRRRELHMFDHRLCDHILTMLSYGRMAGFYLITAFLMTGSGKKILHDQYLLMDLCHLNMAIDIWNYFQKSVRPYIGLISPKILADKMGGIALRKLVYIAVEVGKRSQPTLSQLQITPPPDQVKLDELIMKYFPPDTDLMGVVPGDLRVMEGTSFDTTVILGMQNVFGTGIVLDEKTAFEQMKKRNEELMAKVELLEGQDKDKKPAGKQSATMSRSSSESSVGPSKPTA